jgi:hypothetical protein
MRVVRQSLQFRVRKELRQRRFVERADAQDLENGEQARLNFELLSDDRPQHVNAHRDLQLRAHRVGRRAIKRLDPQMLFDPFEEQLDAPAQAVEARPRQRGQAEMVGQKYQRPLLLHVVETHPPQFVGIGLGRVEAGQRNGLIAAQSSGRDQRMGMQPAVVEPVLGADDEERLRLLDGVAAGKVQAPPVHDINGVGLERQLIEPVDLVRAAFGHADRGGNAAAHIPGPCRSASRRSARAIHNRPAAPGRVRGR